MINTIEINNTKKRLVLSKAKEEDIPVIIHLIELLATHHGISHHLMVTKELLQESLFCEKPYAEVILARVDNIPVGYMLFSYHFSTLLGKPTLYLVDLFIVPDKRHQGIGSDMLCYLAQIAEEKKCGRLEWSVLSSNQTAINFYEHLGIDRLDEWNLYRISGNKLKNLALGKIHD